MKKLIYFLSMILFTTLLWQGCENDDLPGSIYGTVVDKATGEPIKSAGVELSPGGLKTVTGSEGQFEFTQLNPGSYTLLVTKTGYIDFASNTIVVESAQTAKGDVQIEKLPPALKVVNDSRQEISELDFGSSVDDVARSFSLFNDGEESLEWQIVATTDWVKSISKEEGVLSAGATQALIVIIDRKLLKSGENSTTLHITSNNGSKQLDLKATGPTLATLNTLAATNIKTTTATLNGQILTDGSPKYSERGFVYSETSMPTIDNCIKKVTSTLTDSKTYSAIVAGLTKGKTYYVRAYAINAGKEAYSTNEVSFTPSDALPQVSTQEVTNISRTAGKATFNGTIIDEGDPIYTERGFVYATTHNPMVDSDTKVVATGKGRGEFVANATNLQLGNTYYVRAYTINEQGIAYGEEMSFDFNAIMPTIEIGSVVNLTESTASFNGTIVSTGEPAYTECGFVYGTMSLPTLDNGATKVEVSMQGVGAIQATVNSLILNNTYYVRAYAVSSGKVVYGNVESFKASDSRYTVLSASNLMVSNFDLGGGASWNLAIQMCEEYSHAGFTDWYLPTFVELSELFYNKYVIPNLILESTLPPTSVYPYKDNLAHYWSSKTNLSDEPYYINFSNEYGEIQTSYSKYYTKSVRCVRKINNE